METIYAIVENGVVFNCIVAEDWHEGIDISVLEPRPGIGWAYDASSGVFTPPPSPAPNVVRRLTQGEFLRRFTMLERIAMQGSDDPIVRDGILLLTNAGEVLVDDPDTIAFVGYVQQQGYITAERAVEILKA